MKTALLKGLTLLYCCLSTLTWANGTKISAGTSDYQAGLGDGWDKKTEVLKGNCLMGTIVSQGISTATTNFQQKISYDQLEKELGFGAAGRARYGVVEMSASAKFLSNSKSDSFSIAASYAGTYAFKNLSLTEPTLTPQMKPIIENDLKWEEACGHEYVQQLQLGAKIYFTIRIDFASELEKRAFEASFSLKGPLWGVEASLKTASSQFSKRTTVTISTLQVGGEIDKVSSIYGNSDNLISCSLGEFDQCAKVLSSALNYATQEFPKQIAKETLTAQLGTGPVVISYLTKPYATAGIFPKNSPEVTEEVKRSRLKLNEYLTQYYASWVYANRYTQLIARRLSTRQLDLINAVKETIDKDIEQIVRVAQLCYDNPSLICVEEVNALNPSGKNPLIPISKDAFLIENETFAQFCDDGSSPGPYSGPQLKESVVGLMDLAKRINLSAFKPPQPNAQVDECSIAGQVFKGLRTLDASHIGLSDLRPLMEFTQLENLDLSDNQIESLAPFQLGFIKYYGGFSRLKTLRLRNNKIRELAPLVELLNLEDLDLCNNLIQTAEELKLIKNLRRVDLRNNSQYLKLELPPPAKVLTADHGNSVLFMDIPRVTQVPRYGHSSVQLPNGETLISGGIYHDGSGNGGELFNPTTGLFNRLEGMMEARQWHTMTKLQDGNLLIAGGALSDTAEIFESRTYRFRPLRENMMQSRGGHTATLLNDGRVLLTGGAKFRNFGSASLSAEIYDPTNGRFLPINGGMSVPRYFHTASLLKDGRVLIIGGRSDSEVANTADIFDPATNSFQAVQARMQARRASHTATVLTDGTVLIVGGIEADKAHNTAELFDPKSMRFYSVGSFLKVGRMGHQAALTENGVVIITGGSTTPETILADRSCKSCVSTAEIYDPLTRDFTQANNSMVAARVFHSISPLDRNRFLIIGGLGKDAGMTAEILTYTPPTNGEKP